jgi:hypothetical protein
MNRSPAPRHRASPGYGGEPWGVAVLAVLIGTFGGAWLAAGVWLCLGGTALTIGGVGFTVFGSGGAVAGLLTVLLGTAILAIAIGLWNLELWAIAVAALALLSLGAAEYLAQAWLDFLVTAVVLVCLVAVCPFFEGRHARARRARAAARPPPSPGPTAARGQVRT